MVQPLIPSKHLKAPKKLPYKGPLHGSLKEKVRLKKNSWEHEKVVFEVRKFHSDIVRPIRMSNKPPQKIANLVFENSLVQNLYKTCTKLVQNLYKTCTTLVQNLYKTCIGCN